MDNNLTFRQFLQKYWNISVDFISSFYKFFDVEEYDEWIININYDIVLDWLDINKRSFKDWLIKNFTKNVDYKIKTDK